MFHDFVSFGKNICFAAYLQLEDFSWDDLLVSLGLAQLGYQDLVNRLLGYKIREIYGALQLSLVKAVKDVKSRVRFCF